MNHQTRDFVPTERTTLRRLADRGTYDRETVYAILDEGFVCHVGFVFDRKPVVVPTAYARQGSRLLLHGSAGNRMLRALAAGAEACVSVTLVDGLVFSRSAFHHSVNYRSVVIFAAAREVIDSGEKLSALRAIVAHIAPARWAEVRPPNDAELAMTKVVELPIEEASAKVRTGPPLDDAADYASTAWAGVLPLATVAGLPEPCPQLARSIEVPASVSAYRRQRTR